MNQEFQVKGSSLSSKFDFVRERFGPDAEAEFKDRFAGQCRFPILDSAWYPFTLYEEILDEIADRYFDGDRTRLQEVGRYSAEKVLTTIYQAYALGKDFPGFLDRIATLHERFYSQGRMRVELGEDGRSCAIRIVDAPAYSAADLNVAAGFYLGAAQVLGARDPTCSYHQERDGVRFDVRWQ